jgi:ABC-type transport system involved in cytochrome bd biosynthesis fused ATPase/permease subunit
MAVPFSLAFFLLLSTSTILSVYSFSAPSPSTFSWTPCSIELNHVSQQYPVTLWRKLTSSEPRREFAVENVDLSLTSDFLLLVGASSSGKSTILRLILGRDEPVDGSVRISTLSDDSSMLQPALPVLLEERPVYSSQLDTVRIILTNKIKALSSSAASLDGTCTLVTCTLVVKLMDELSDILDLSLEQKGSDLSPSEAYRCSIAEACLYSMLYNNHDANKENTISRVIAAPILLMDEWMDTETSTVIQKVQSSLLKLVDRGATVVSITHKPELYKIERTIRCVTLSRGKIVSAA